MLLFPYIKKIFIYLYVWSADCNSAIYSESQYLAGVGIGILECEYGPGAGVSISGGRGITTWFHGTKPHTPSKIAGIHNITYHRQHIGLKGYLL